jgi:hypothetical protein
MLPGEHAGHDRYCERHGQEGRARIFQLEADRCHIYSGSISKNFPIIL